MRIARVADGVVTAILAFDNEANWQEIVPDGIVAPAANVGDLWDGSTFSRPAPSPPTQAELYAYATRKRWVVENSGVTVLGFPVATDTGSQTKVIGARLVAEMTGDGFTTPWVAMDGSVHALDRAGVTALSEAVLLHVAQCFAVYAQVASAISDGDITTFADIEAAPWPQTAGGE